MIIAFTGNIGHGKDLVAKMFQYYILQINSKISKHTTIVDFLNNKIREDRFDWKIKKFAFKLKVICAAILNCRVEDFENSDFKNKLLPDYYQTLIQQTSKKEKDFLTQHTYRWFLQHMADEIKKLLGKDYFVNELLEHYKEEYVDGHPLVWDEEDGEEDWSKSKPNWLITDLRFLNEAKIVKENGGIIVRVIRTSIGSNTEEHSSETELEAIKHDYLFYNDVNGLQELYNSLSETLFKTIFLYDIETPAKH